MLLQSHRDGPTFRRDNAVVFLAAWADACGLWRMQVPHLNLPGSSFFCFRAHPNFEVIAGNDIVVVQRCCTKAQYEFLKLVRVLGMKIVYDLDDLVTDIPEYNPAYKLLQQYQEGFRYCARMVDVITVSTKTLAREVQRHFKPLVNSMTGKEIPVVIADNRLDERMFAAPIKDSRVIVGWAGSSSHIGDLPIIESAICHLAKEHPEVAFEFRGCELPADSAIPRLPNYQFRYWTPTAEYGARMPRWGWHIALAPVTDHPFNNSKSCIKALEAAYCKIPCLMSWVTPYEEFCRHNKELQWLLCASPSSWELKLRELINDPARCAYYGDLMHQVLIEHYSFRRPHEGWNRALEMARSI